MDSGLGMSDRNFHKNLENPCDYPYEIISPQTESMLNIFAAYSVGISLLIITQKIGVPAEKHNLT